MLPNFFIIGANKAGTTSLYHYLEQHPDIFMSPLKEPCFWSLGGEVSPDLTFQKFMVPDRADYEALFEGVAGEHAIGEASTPYMQSDLAAALIRSEIPDARVMAVLRDPAERAYSAYCMHFAEGIEPLTDFGEAIDADLAGGSWRHYLIMGRYGRGMGLWYEQFPREQIKVFLYEEFGARPQALMRETFEFLGVDPDFTPSLTDRANVTLVPRNMTVFRFAKRSSRTKDMLKRVMPASTRARLKKKATDWNSGRPGPLSPEVRARLIEYYAEDIERTEVLIGRDLAAWKTV